MTITFGLIAEGPTDQIILEDILYGWLGEDIVDEVRYLQPDIDGDGGWGKVFNYCRSSDFQLSLQTNDYLIIQVDTDVSEEKGFDVTHRDKQGNIVSPEILIENVKAKLIELIGSDFYQENSERIIFAISVHSMECWLLPLYYQDNNKEKIERCFTLLGKKINELNKQKKIKFYFDLKNKVKIPDYYRQISYQYSKNKILLKHYEENPSLKLFIEELQTKVSNNAP
jgi:hypothetical protein